jgi:hypothetical protein
MRADTGFNHRHNFDGFLTYTWSSQSTSAHSYVQVFRSGSVEVVDASILRLYGDRRIIPSGVFEGELLQALRRYLFAQRQLGVEPPLFVMLSLLGVSGYTMGIKSPPMRWDYVYPIDKDALLVPEIVVESFECDPAEAMKPIFDAVWNAAGWPRSMNYDETGKWVRP